jgi:transposase
MDMITTVGLDIAKNSFAVHGLDAGGVTVLTKELKRGQVLAFFAKLSPCRVGLEACNYVQLRCNYGDSRQLR